MKIFNTLTKGVLPLILLMAISVSVQAQQAHIARSAKKEQMAKQESAQTTQVSQGIQVEMKIKSQPDTPATPMKQALLDKYGNDEVAIVAARKVIENYENQGFKVMTQTTFDNLKEKTDLSNSESTQQLDNIKILEEIIK